MSTLSSGGSSDQSARERAAEDSREQAALLEAAEDRLDLARVEKDADRVERRGTLRMAGIELARLSEALAGIKSRTGGFGPELTSEVDVALACVRRLTRALEQALDPEDLRGDHHDLGGSG